MIKISVIIPVYNTERYINRCVESVLRQTIKDIEIVLLVGICKDDSLQHCVNLQRRDERIIVVSRKDTSLGDARNYGLRIAKGEYISFVDADDYLSIDYLEKMMKVLQDNSDVDISCCGYDKVLEDGTSQRGFFPEDEGIVNVDFNSYLQKVKEARVWVKMFRRKWYLKHSLQMFDGCCEDQALNMQLAALVKKVYMIPEVLYHYNIENENSLIRTLKSQTDYPKAMEYAITYLQKNNFYEENRQVILDKICSMICICLENTEYTPEMVAVSKTFLEKYYPEAIEYYWEDRRRQGTDFKKYVIYGAGEDAEKFLAKVPSEDIAYIVDQNTALHETGLNGVKILPTEKLWDEKEEVAVIIATSRFYYEVVRKLREKIYLII